MRAEMKSVTGTAARAAVCVLAAGAAPSPSAPPPSAGTAVGDTYAYRYTNGFSKEQRGDLRYRIDKVEADRITVSVTPDTPAAGVERVEIYTRDGNWLRHLLDTHG